MNIFENSFQRESMTLQSILTLTFMREGRKKKKSLPLGYH